MRRRLGMLTVSVVLVAAACAPDSPGPVSPTWITTHVTRTTTANSTTNYVGAWTDTNWASTLEVTTINGGGGSASLLIFPRSGPGNSTLGTPQTLTPTVSPSLVGPIGRHVIGLGGSLAGAGAVEFFKEAAGTWGSIGTVTIPNDFQLAGIDDHWMVLRSILLNPGTETSVRVYAIDADGPTVSATLAATLAPDPSWPLALREGFGGPGVAIDGDLLVVGAQGQFSPTPGGARVFRATAGTWAPVLSLGASPTGPNGFARALAADDGTTVDRIALGPQSDTAPVVEIYADTGAGFALEQTITRDAGDPDVFGGGLFGNAVGLDGDVLAVSSRGVMVPSAQTGHADVKVGYVQIFRKGATWTEEAEVPTFTVPATAGVTSSLPFKLQVAGNHVGAYQFLSPDPPPGCQFPCFVFGFEAWSIDRTA